MSDLYAFCMALGQATGCHQMSERSFVCHGKQFPVCARCTGVFLGELTGILSLRWIRPPVWLLISFCVVMLLDWGIQALGWKESTNARRLLTGTLCGYAFGCGTLMLLKWLIL